jgi:hypothetical protein
MVKRSSTPLNHVAPVRRRKADTSIVEAKGPICNILVAIVAGVEIGVVKYEQIAISRIT